MDLSNHLIIAPILLPLLTGALLLLFDERKHTLKALLSVGSTLLLVAMGMVLLRVADSGTASVYLLGNWAAPFGIVLVLDRLSAVMLLVTSLLAIASLFFSLARWDKMGSHFHSLFQFLLMGLNGAFLTGDLFNLFVFFEVVLSASYGLLLHGSGPHRVRAGLHYIAMNLAASFLFLVGVALIYGVTGTLNMADLVGRIGEVPPENRFLLEAGAAILGIAFLVKAGMWPLCFWLPSAYSAAAAPVAAIFAVLSKMGIYVLLRLSPLLFGAAAGSSAGFDDKWLFAGGLVTLAFGTIGVLASQAMVRLAAFSVLVSSGTLLAAVAMSGDRSTAAALYYMISSTLTIGALFLLIELLERAQDPAAAVLSVTMEAYGDGDEDEPEEEVGVTIPATLAILGVSFGVCGILLSGLPPLSGFVGKFALLSAAIDAGNKISTLNWFFFGLLITSGLFAMVAMVRAGIRIFWAPVEIIVPRVRVIEFVPVAFLLILCIWMTAQAGPTMRYLDAAANALHDPTGYVHDVLSAAPIPSPKEAGH
ncbi:MULTISPECIES: monovalent cation/H+ antiporter subunit D [Mesorhizobium]|uniref:Monovalent cation/H+ antiporter subunit D n=1 Tax=Mesorhizobium denitrificans TaxID=2294114 RepID=A0A371X932_9HYPH|nr:MULTISPECIES: monovalent cation/H+ antiporter subunit D [Mesorhizobium]RFC65710.1 monovalent cation/H+ antiporter subunit D [Mesorhizobium denitrificans]